MKRILWILLALLALPAQAETTKEEYRDRYPLFDRSAKEWPDVERCLSGWPDNPFSKQKDVRYRVLSSSVHVFGIGDGIRDEAETSWPQLVFVRPAVNVLGGQTLELLNPNGWYCLESSVAVLSKSTIRVACDAHLATLGDAVTVLGANDGQQGVTVLGQTTVQRVGCGD